MQRQGVFANMRTMDHPDQLATASCKIDCRSNPLTNPFPPSELNRRGGLRIPTITPPDFKQEEIGREEDEEQTFAKKVHQLHLLHKGRLWEILKCEYCLGGGRMAGAEL